MSSCDITCPFCDLEFEETEINEIGNAEITCKYCDQEFTVNFEAEITVDIIESTVGEEFAAKRKIGQESKYEKFVIYLGMKDCEDVYYSIHWGSHEEKDYKQAHMFNSEDLANRGIRMWCDKVKYPYAHPVKFRDCVAKENDLNDKGLFKN